MSADPPKRVHRSTAPWEDLLCEARIVGEAEKQTLAGLLAAAAAPARDAELSGEEAAITAFREAKQAAAAESPAAADPTTTGPASAPRDSGHQDSALPDVDNPNAVAAGLHLAAVALPGADRQDAAVPDDLTPGRSTRVPLPGEHPAHPAALGNRPADAAARTPAATEEPAPGRLSSLSTALGTRPSRPARSLRSLPSFRMRTVRAAALGVAAAVAASVAAVAVATGGGSLPAVLGGGEPVTTAGAEAGHAQTGGSSEAATAGTTAGPSASQSPAEPSTTGGAAAPADGQGSTPRSGRSSQSTPLGSAEQRGNVRLDELCGRYLQGTTLTMPQYDRLTLAADGRSKIRGYCEHMRSGKTSGSQSKQLPEAPEGRSGSGSGSGRSDGSTTAGSEQGADPEDAARTGKKAKDSEGAQRS